MSESKTTEKMVLMSKFKPPKKAIKYRETIKLELVYFEDGEMWSSCGKRVGNKWQHIASTYFEKTPPWKALLNWAYKVIKVDGKEYTLPSGVGGIVNHMKHTVSCFENGWKP